MAPFLHHFPNLWQSYYSRQQGRTLGGEQIRTLINEETRLLEYLDYKAFEIPGLRHAGENGMVCALATLLDQSNIAFGIAGCEADAVPQICLGHWMRTTTCNQKPVRLQQFQTQQIDIL